MELDGTAYRSGLPGFTVRSRTSAHQARFDEQSRTLAKLSGSLDFFAAQRARERLLGLDADAGGSGSGSGSGSGRPIARRTPGEIIQQASTVQGQSQSSVSRSVRLVQEARQVGAATVGQLGEQRAQLHEVHHTVAGFVETLGHAEREAKKYASGLFDDTAQLVCLTVILLGLAFVGIMQLSEVGAASTDDAEHRLQATLVTVNDFDRDRGPWRWGGSLDVDEYSPGDYSHVQFRGLP